MDHSIASSVSSNQVKEVLVSDGTRAMALSPDKVLDRRVSLIAELDSIMNEQQRVNAVIAERKLDVLVAATAGLDAKQASRDLNAAAEQRRRLGRRRIEVQGQLGEIGKIEKKTGARIDYGDALCAILSEVKELRLEIRALKRIIGNDKGANHVQ